MKTIEDIKNEMKRDNLNPDDFDIEIKGNRYAVIPRRSYEIREISKREGKPIAEDVNVTAETMVYAIQDIIILADTVTQLASKIIELEDKTND